MADGSRIEELRRRVELDPASIAFAVLAEEYRRAGRVEEAIATCTAGLLRHPAYLSAHVTLGRALIDAGRFDAARHELEFVLKLAPENLTAIRGLAEIHHRRSDDDHAHHTAALDDHVRRDGALDEHPRREASADKASPASPRAPQSEALRAAEDRVDPGYGAFDTPAAARIDPALAGLEAFLGAIERARDERAAGR